MGKLTKQFLRFIIIDMRRVNWRRESPKIDRSVTQCYLDRPFVPSFIPTHALIPACVGAYQSLVPFVLRAGAQAKIATTIIKRIVIMVISLFASHTSENDAMHVYKFMAFTSDSVDAINGDQCTPVPLVQPIVIDSINQRILSARKRNNAIGWIDWLGDWMPLNPAFRHESSAKGFVQPNHPTLLLPAFQYNIRATVTRLQ